MTPTEKTLNLAFFYLLHLVWGIYYCLTENVAASWVLQPVNQLIPILSVVMLYLIGETVELLQDGAILTNRDYWG